jgi:hypothetical protein
MLLRLLCLGSGSRFRGGALLRLLCLGSGSRFRSGALLRLLCLGSGSRFRRGVLLRLLCLGSSSRFRGGVLLRLLCLGSRSRFRPRFLLRSGVGCRPLLGLLTYALFCRRFLLLRSGVRCSPLLGLLSGSGLGRGPLLRLLMENFLLLCTLLRSFLLCGGQARGMWERRSRGRRGRGFTGRPCCPRMICRLLPCEPGRLRERCGLMRDSLRCAGRLYRTRGCGFRFRLSRGPKPRSCL